MNDTPPKPLKWRQQRDSRPRNPKKGGRGFLHRMAKVLVFPWPRPSDMARDAKPLPGGWLDTMDRHARMEGNNKTPSRSGPRVRRWLARLLGR